MDTATPPTNDPTPAAKVSARAAAAPGVVAALQRAISQPAFLAAFMVLFVAALGLNAATQYMRLYFKKEAVPLRMELDVIPQRIGPWVQVSVDKSLDPEMLDVLGTKKYIFRDYVDSRQVSETDLAEFSKFTEREIMGKLSEIRAAKPSAVIRAAVTYYTGLVDTVAHVPDRCYVADGYEPDSHTYPNWDLGPTNNGGKPLKVCLINFEDTSQSRGNTPHNVAYFFQCDGDYVSDPVSVRLHLQNLFEHKAYYAKVELMNEMADRDKSSDAMRDFLTFALPDIEKCLPDWKVAKASE